MSIAARGLTAIGKLAVIGVLLGAFGVGMAGVIYVSLSGSEIKVPEIVGKDFVQSEKELAALGLKLKKRADRASTEPINTVIEQLPKAGETVKTGQLILVVVSKAGLTEEEVAPPSLKNIDEDDSDKIEEMISDKPKKAKSNTNSTKKKADTSRDTIDEDKSSDTSNSNKADEPRSDSGDKKDPAGGTVDKKGDPKAPAPKTPATPPAARPSGTESKPRQP